MDSAFPQTLPLQIRAEVAAKQSYAAHQNSVPFLRSLELLHQGTSDISDVVLQLVATPPFLKPRTWRVESLRIGDLVEIADRDVLIDGGFLLNLHEAISGTVTFSAHCGTALVGQQSLQVELLARNQWGGTDYQPDLLAAFSQPNDPAVDKLLHAASQLLQAGNRTPGIDGYESGDRRRVWEITAAIFGAIRSLNLSYSLPPAGFEVNGQKIRLPSQIMSGKVATCLDSTMLFASVLEQANLNPIIVLLKEHALIGVWLQKEELSSIVIDQAETLRKRIQLKELILLETTLARGDAKSTFKSVLEAGAWAIRPEVDDNFGAAIDIRRARSHKIRPLAFTEVIEATGSPEVAEEDEFSLPEAPDLPSIDFGLNPEPVDNTPAGRLARWQRKLLDLTAHNPLLNHRSTKSSLRLLCPDPGLLEDKLAAGARITLLSASESGTKSQDHALHRQRTGENLTVEFAKALLSNNQVAVDLSKEDLASSAVDVFRKTETALLEGGSNTLFLAIGFLLWKQKPEESRRFRAPLILLPVTLNRKSARSDFSLSLHDDEPRFNTTLLELLRTDFEIDIRGLDGSLPTDASGIDVRGVWDMVRIAVKNAAGFEVVEDTVLGNFSFAKYLMWKDLVDRVDDLRNNPVVKHLMDSPREVYASETSFIEPSRLDEDFAPSDLLTPLQADASQLSAIASADRGKDFVIIGPPGTGKSQTISNMIAHLIGKGKTVLFVSEKVAALEVVHRRLEEIGLGQFCLPLHSNKAKKAEVLARLERTWRNGASASSGDWEEQAKRLGQTRDQLNGLVNRLHKRHENGLTVHQAIGIKVRDEHLASKASFSWPNLHQHTKADLDAMRQAVSDLGLNRKQLGNVNVQRLGIVAEGDWSPLWENQLVEAARNLVQGCADLTRSVDEFLKSSGFSITGRSSRRLSAIQDLASLLLDSWRKQGAFALGSSGSERIEALEDAVTRLRTYATLQAKLSCAYDPLAWKAIDGSDLAKRWGEASATWWPRSVFMKRSILKDLASKGARGVPQPENDAPVLQELRIQGQAIENLDKILSSIRAWNKHSTDPRTAEDLVHHGLRVRSVLGRLGEDSSEILQIQSQLVPLLEDGNDLLAPDALVGRHATEVVSAFKRYRDRLDQVAVFCNPELPTNLEDNADPMLRLSTECEDLVSERAELKNWCSYLKARKAALDLELSPIVLALEQGELQLEELPRSFEAAYCTWWSAGMITEDAVLRSFSAAEHSQKIQDFGVRDAAFRNLTAKYIAASLRDKIQHSTSQATIPGWGMLNREVQKKKNHKPIRKLLEEIPDVITTLSPCMMMSPLSVAQYLSADHAMFDVVIFDEASQITVWDAIGALARGRQVVVAGDPKQMPPTNFFARNTDEDPEGDLVEDSDLESILDEMQGASLPTRTLNLHYRSRRESLIAFSNNRYYDDKLVTFPAPQSPDKGITLVRHEGFYARGGARHNEVEAKAIVSEILQRLKFADPSGNASSIGVVTFNTQQQKLIEDLLDDARAQNPDIEWAFNNDPKFEGVFVKNLETVQGDERDTILFSVAFGPDSTGHLTMNFGPLNRTGGERRLNVALTRARSEMKVFSCLPPERIDLSKTQAQAVKDLKHFLEYAERGPSALARSVHGSVGDYDSPFEEAVAQRLKEKGWNVHTQVGVSAYRIDLGIVDPDFPGMYLAGIECDGAMYHSSLNARERDLIRQRVLENLGWTILRVWSTDWWNNPCRCTDTLDNALRDCMARARMKRPEQDQTSATHSVTSKGTRTRPPAAASLFWVPVDSSGSPIPLLVSKVPSKEPVTKSQAHLILHFKLERLAEREGPKAVLAAVRPFPELTELLSWTSNPEGIPAALAGSEGAWNLLSTVDWKASTVAEMDEEKAEEMSNPEQTFAEAVETIVSNWYG